MNHDGSNLNPRASPNGLAGRTERQPSIQSEKTCTEKLPLKEKNWERVLDDTIFRQYSSTEKLDGKYRVCDVNSKPLRSRLH
jgi:hypothetical protein